MTLVPNVLRMFRLNGMSLSACCNTRGSLLFCSQKDVLGVQNMEQKRGTHVSQVSFGIADGFVKTDESDELMKLTGSHWDCFLDFRGFVWTKETDQPIESTTNQAILHQKVVYSQTSSTQSFDRVICHEWGGTEANHCL